MRSGLVEPAQSRLQTWDRIWWSSSLPYSGAKTTAWAETPSHTIAEPTRNNCRIDYLTDASNTNSWAPPTTLLLPFSPYFWVDVSSTNQPKRFYRAVRVP